jgi:hypothetical protein
MGEMSVGYGSIFAEEIFNALINKKDKDRVLLEQLMVEIVGAKGGISVQEWSKGLIAVMEFIEDVKIDVPKCDEWLGKMCGRLLDNKIISIRAIDQILKLLKDGILAVFTWGIIQVHGDAVNDRAITNTFRRSFAWLSKDIDKDTPNKYVSALAQGCPAKGIKIGAQILLGQELTDGMDSNARETDKADLGYCVGASWAAAHQRFRTITPDQIDMSIIGQLRSSAAWEQFIHAVYHIAKLDRWKDALTDERLDALAAAGIVPNDSLQFTRDFMKK